MPTPLEDYKALIDGLAKVRAGVLATWVRSGAFPATPEYARVSGLCAQMKEEDREAIATLVEHAREGGIHDALVFLHDRMMIDGLRFTKNGRELPLEPFDTQLYYDWMCRVMGDSWPDE